MEHPSNKRIPGGYILKARKIDKSWISKAPPHVREIWDWILRNVNYQDKIVGGKLIKRGQKLITWDAIIEDLSWMVGYRKMKYKKHHCEIAMNALMKQTMITTTRTTRGTIVTVCNYDYYQTPKNYENDHENEATTTAKTTGYGNDKQECKELKNDKNIKNKKRTPVPPKGDNGFDSFWQSYPRHDAKAAAFKAWDKINPSSELIATILQSLENQKQSPQWLKDNGQFIPLPATWLNGRRWEDEGPQIKDWREW